MKRYLSQRLLIQTAIIAVIFPLLCIQTGPSQAQIRPAYTAEYVAQMLDYVSRDYALAVSDGRVIDEDEYAEQLVVCHAALEVADQIHALRSQPTIRQGILTLIDKINGKFPASTIKQQAVALRDEIFLAGGVSISPPQWPNQAHGKKVFEAHCVSCHGISGDGQGAIAHTLSPRPANFLDPVRMKGASPLSAYGAIKMGITGTPMPAYTQLSDSDLWAVSFYLTSLRHRNASPSATGRVDPTAASIWLKAAASLTDDELVQALPGSGDERNKLLPLLRLYSE